MNFAAIEARIMQGDMSLDALHFLLSCKGECEWLDYKEELHLSSDASVAAFSRDVLAMKNIGGGYLLIGVRDKTWQPVGLNAHLPYDTKLLRDAVRRCTGLDLDIDVVNHVNVTNTGTGIFALILVRGTRKRKRRRMPTLVARDFAAKENYGLRRGEIYIRKGDSTVRIQSPEDLADLLDSLDEATDQSALESAQTSSPFAISDGTYRLLEKGFD
jgi:predicted HTH transcriptional regulator